MEITLDIIFSYVSTYLLAGTVCFLGCFIREIYAASKSHTRINVIRMIAQTVSSAFVGCVIVRLCSIFVIPMEIEFFMGLMFLLGFWADSVMDLLYGKTTIVRFLQNVLENFGTIGKVFAKAWRDADKENDDRKEKNNINKHIKNNTEKDE